MDSDCWQEHAVNVTLDSMEGALNWIWDLKTTVPRSETCSVEGILKALADQHVSNLCERALSCFFSLLYCGKIICTCALTGHVYLVFNNGRKSGIPEP